MPWHLTIPVRRVAPRRASADPRLDDGPDDVHDDVDHEMGKDGGLEAAADGHQAEEIGQDERPGERAGGDQAKEGFPWIGTSCGSHGIASLTHSQTAPPPRPHAAARTPAGR